VGKKVKLDEVIWDPSIYPRKTWNTATIKRYVEAHEAGETFPPMTLEEGTNRLLDGKHRYEMYREAGVAEVSVVYAKVPEGVPVKLFAASLSARHGDRLSNGDAKTVAREICTDNPEFDQSQIAKVLGLKQPTISGYVSDLIAKRREERRAKVLRLAMLGWTQREIAERLGVDQATVSLDMKNIETDIFHTGHAPEEIALRLGWPVQLVKAKMLEGADDEARLADLGIKTQPYDVWNFAKCHDLMGDKHPGRIPGELVCHVLYFYTKPGQLVLDPMAGSGTTLDACLLMGRKCRGYDIDHRHERIDVEQHDLSKDGWPARVSKASLIFWDPPYFDKMDDANVKDGYGENSISKLDREAYLAFFAEAFASAYATAKPGTVLAFLMSDWNDNEGKRDGIFLWDYADLLFDAGWKLERQIQTPLPTQQVHPDIVNKFRASKKLARLGRYLLIARR